MQDRSSSESIDLIIRGGSLVDGTGAPAREGDLCLVAAKWKAL
jgi:hypothetical protein